MKQKMGKNVLKTQLLINPHPPDKYRTNVPLSRFPIFRTIYNIKKGDKMYWKSTSRIWLD
jgi:predicted metalloendopeptidase